MQSALGHNTVDQLGRSPDPPVHVGDVSTMAENSVLAPALSADWLIAVELLA